MYCQKCGAPNDKNARLCKECGKAFEPPLVETRKHVSKYDRIGWALLGLLLLGFLLIGVMNSHNPS